MKWMCRPCGLSGAGAGAGWGEAFLWVWQLNFNIVKCKHKANSFRSVDLKQCQPRDNAFHGALKLGCCVTICFWRESWRHTFKSGATPVLSELLPFVKYEAG